MPTISWLHLSDFHSCNPRHGWDSDRVTETLIEDLKLLSTEHGLCPQLLFFTGDGAFGRIGRSKEEQIAGQLKLFGDWLGAVRASFEPAIPLDNTFLVPGNHDVDRSWISSDQTEWLDRQGGIEPVVDVIHECGVQWRRYMDRLDSFRMFLESSGFDHLLDSELGGTTHADPSRLLYAVQRQVQGITLGIGGFNSAWSCGRSGEKGRLWMAGKWQQGTIRKGLKEVDIPIALMHHPPSWLVEHESPAFRRGLEQDFRFLLYGHEHEQWVTANGKMSEIAAAACYDRGDSGRNGYSLVRLDTETGRGQVWLRTFDPVGGGWVPKNVKDKTNEFGIWPLDLPWLKKIHPKRAMAPVLSGSNKALAESAVDLESNDLEYLERMLSELKGRNIDSSSLIKRIRHLKREQIQAQRVGQSPVMKGGEVFKGRFELSRKIGEGGFGSVWKAWDKHSKTSVAIKILLPHLTQNEEARRRFKRGARCMSRLAPHSNIVNIVDLSLDGDPCWFAMRYVECGNLKAAIEKKVLTRADIFRVLENIADALEHVWQEERLVHRDIKPLNILIDKNRKGVLTDFDLVKAPESVSTTVAIGDIGFSAPEVLHFSNGSKEEESTPRTDVYSLAATAVYALSGGSDPILGHPSIDLALEQAELVGVAAGAVRKALAREPENRPDSPRSLVQALKIPSPAMTEEELKSWKAQPPGAPESPSHESMEQPLWYRVSPAASSEELVRSYRELQRIRGAAPDRNPFFEGAGRPLDPQLDIKLVEIPGGEFEMGSPIEEPEHRKAEEPQHLVRVLDFRIAETPITNAQYKVFDPEHRFRDGHENHPVVKVSWWDAQLFSLWLGARLPSEAEWEYACRAGCQGPFAFGKELTRKQANYKVEGVFRETTEVKSFPANDFGLYDMHGNVWEWCEDTRQENYIGAPDDATPWVDPRMPARIVRGGSWFNPKWQARSAHRIGWFPDLKIPSLGFRPACSIPF